MEYSIDIERKDAVAMMKEQKLLKQKPIEEIIKELHEWCKGCPAFSGTDCTRNPYTEGCLREKQEGR